MSALSVMVKDRVVKLPKEDRQNYVLRLSKVDYKNLSATELQAYKKMAEDLNRKRMEIYKIIQIECEVN